MSYIEFISQIWKNKKVSETLFGAPLLFIKSEFLQKQKSWQSVSPAYPPAWMSRKGASL
jgi:hypothetical protein